MRSILRYIPALLAVVCLMGAAILGTLALVTTEAFAREICTAELTAMQQQRIDDTAQTLTETWNLSPDLLSPWTETALEDYQAAVAAWWGDLWQDEEAELTPPFYLTDAEIGDVVSVVRSDAGFIALTDETQRRATAMNDVAYVLDEAVSDAVMPLRTTLLSLALNMLREIRPLPVLHEAAVLGAIWLAVLALILLIPAYRAAGSVLTAMGLTLAMLTIPVWVMDIPGRLAELNGVAALQGWNALLCLAVCWYGLAAVLMGLGGIILAIKKSIRRRTA